MENPAGCTGKGKRMKGNTGEKNRTVDSAKFKFCGEIMRMSFEGKEGGGCGRVVNGERKRGQGMGGTEGKRSLRFQQFPQS